VELDSLELFLFFFLLRLFRVFSGFLFFIFLWLRLVVIFIIKLQFPKYEN